MADKLGLQVGAAEALANLRRVTFTVPESARSASDPKAITIRELTFMEERQALEAKEKGGGQFPTEGAMRSLDSFDGNPITWENDQRQRSFEGLSNKVRDLLVDGFCKSFLPTRDERDSFLSSAVTSV